MNKTHQVITNFITRRMGIHNHLSNDNIPAIAEEISKYFHAHYYRKLVKTKKEYQKEIDIRDAKLRGVGISDTGERIGIEVRRCVKCNDAFFPNVKKQMKCWRHR